MTYDNFTIKAQESILKAQQLAGSFDQQTVDTPHLIRGIMMTDEHVPQFLLKKMDVSIPRLQKELDDAIRTYPKVEGADKQFLTNDSNKALSRAKKNLKEYGDEYISVEMILLGIIQGVQQELHEISQQHSAQGIDQVTTQTEGEEVPVRLNIAQQTPIQLPVSRAGLLPPMHVPGD